MKKKSILRIIGVFYIILGFLILLNSFGTITGLVIVDNIEPQIISVLGIIVISLGFLITIAIREKEGNLEKNISLNLYKANKGDENESYMMTDPEFYFESTGAISLGRFKREIHHLKESSTGDELIKIVRESYEPSLIKLAESPDREKSEIAIKFLKVLDPSYKSIDKKLESGYTIKRDEREEIKSAFRSYDGRLTQEQRLVLKKFNLEIENGAKHFRIFYSGTNYNSTLQHGKPSDFRTGLNFTTQLVNLIEKGRKHDLEKSKKN
ncbi:MAG: hypothetical protein Q7S27_00205 [Nanoarchaeota archaeon]|nr:hypothetical protein [Nanoarchaeota archaeon]